MSPFAKYVEEIKGMSTLETERGWATYVIVGEECYIEDIWVEKAFRKSGEAARMADEIKRLAKEKGCKFLTGSVNGRIKDPTTSTAVLIAYGFKIHAILQDAILFKMEIL